MRRLYLLAILLLSSQAASALDLKCEALFAPSISERELKRRLGPGNVRTAQIDVGEGYTEEGTVLFPNDPERRVEIFWRDNVQRKHPARVESGGRAYRTYFGIGIGTSLRSLERINGRAFSLSGWDFDEAGGVTSWNDGKLASVGKGRCSMSVWLAPRNQNERMPAEEKAERATEGDSDFSSDNSNMRLLNPRVHWISLAYP